MRRLIPLVLLASGWASAAPFVYPANWTTSKPEEVRTGGTYRFFTISDFKTINPFTSAETPSIPGIIGGTAINTGGFFRLDPVTLEYVPYLAETFSVSKDKLVWTFNIRKGVKWSDGKPLVADDFVTTWKIHTDEDVGSNAYDSFFINDKPVMISKIDDDTVRVTFPTVDATALETASYGPWPHHVFGPVYASKGAAGIKAMWTLSEKPENIVSLGEFKLESYRPGERAIFARNPYFGEWNKDSAGKPLPYLDALSYAITKDLNSAFAQFLAGQLDAFNPRNADDLAQVKRAIDAGNLKATLNPNVSSVSSTIWVTFNWNRKSDPEKQRLFRSSDFRRAMSHLVNRQGIIDIVYGGLGTANYSAIPPVFKDWVSPNLRKFDFNPEAATKLLANLGYNKKNTEGFLVNKSGRVLEFNLATNAGNDQNEKMAQILVSEARKVGVKINFRPIDFNSLVAQLLSTGDDRPFDAILLLLGAGGIIYPLGSNVTVCGGNLHAYNTSGKCLEAWETQLTALFYRGQQELDTAKRKQIAYQIQEIEAQHVPWIYLPIPNRHTSWNARVRGEYPKATASGYVGSRMFELTWIAQ
jgi:peptide/nickel transport system substrate-binding protein